jgi:hypothetical protein
VLCLLGTVVLSRAGSTVAAREALWPDAPAVFDPPVGGAEAPMPDR